MAKFRKATAAFVTATVGLLAIFGFNVDFATPENITAAAAVIAMIVGAVYQFPNDAA